MVKHICQTDQCSARQEIDWAKGDSSYKSLTPHTTAHNQIDSIQLINKF